MKTRTTKQIWLDSLLQKRYVSSKSKCIRLVIAFSFHLYLLKEFESIFSSIVPQGSGDHIKYSMMLTSKVLEIRILKIN